MREHTDHRRRRRVLPAIVFVALLGGSVATATTLDRVIDDQEEKLLEQRTSEATALLGAFFGQAGSTLPLLGVVTSMAPGAEQQVLDGMFQGEDFGATFTATAGGTGVTVTAAAGSDFVTPGPLTGERLTLAQRALRSEEAVTTAFEHDGDRHLAIAVTVPGSDSKLIVQEFAFDARSWDRTEDGLDLFTDMDGAVYASTDRDPDALVLTTTEDIPTPGEGAERTFEVGADEWLVVTKARSPLVGSFARNVPWLILGAGVTTALLVTALLEVFSRRRAYALQLVEDRTAELRDALAERERLEEGQRRAREAAEAANRSKSEFLSRMSHELRTPLNAVLGFAQLLEEAELERADRDAVDQILKGGRHLLGLINEVLDITRIESGTFQLSPEPVLVADVLSGVTELTAPLAAQAGVHLVGATSERCDVHVLADRQRLTQVLLNLVSNAIKYNRPGGTVSLSCEPVTTATLRIKVHDTGPGIRPEHLDLLFTPFERLGAEHTTVEGTGIGLAVSRRLAEAMGGVLDVETALGQGSTFWVELPLVEGPVERYERLGGDAVAAAPAIDQDRRTVLYIEDNVANLHLVERVLAYDESIHLISAVQGRLGVDLAREHRPALILLDLHLPDISGDEVLRQLRDHPETSAIPVAMVSADATPGQIRRLLAEGAYTYLTKPLDVAELRRVVESLPCPTP